MTKISPEEMEVCLGVLQRIADSSGTLSRGERFNSLISKIYREGKRHDLNAMRNRQRAEDRELLATAAMVGVHRNALQSVAALPPSPVATARRLHRPESCYVCKDEYTDVHFFYHFLCPSCADFNFRMRNLRADLTGRTALVTGGRVKIGPQIVLRLLRDNARAIVTTRFPHAAAARLHAEPDSAEWLGRLRIHGLD